MPLHAVTSTVRPASFLYGNGAGYGGPNAMSFPQCVAMFSFMVWWSNDVATITDGWAKTLSRANCRDSSETFRFGCASRCREISLKFGNITSQHYFHDS